MTPLTNVPMGNQLGIEAAYIGWERYQGDYIAYTDNSTNNCNADNYSVIDWVPGLG